MLGFVGIGDAQARCPGCRRLIDMDEIGGLARNPAERSFCPGTRRLSVWSNTRTSLAPVTHFKRSIDSG